MTHYSKLLLLSSIISLTSCGLVETTIEEEKLLDYPEEKTILWDECFTIESNDYYLYFYSETCGHCKNLKEDILSFYSNTTLDLYFVNVTNYYVYGNDVDSLIGVYTLEKLFIPGTPFLLEVKNFLIFRYYMGVTQIKNFIYKIE